MSAGQPPAEAGSSRNSTQTRQRILDEAEALFGNQGFAGTSVRDIATRANLTPASLYNHFSSKDALYRAVLERGVQPLIERLGELATSDDLGETGVRVIEGVMRHLAEHSHLPRLITLEAATGGEHLSEVARDWIRPLADRAMTAFEGSPGGATGWSSEEGPHIVAAWLNLIFGYFSMAPVLEEVLGRDPLSKECLAEQTRFLVRLVRLMEVPGRADD